MCYVSVQDIPAGTEVASVAASDADSGSNGVITFRIVNMGGINSPFAIDGQSGAIRLQESLDRETTPEYTVSQGVGLVRADFHSVLHS